MHPSFESLVVIDTPSLQASLMDILHDTCFRSILEDDSIFSASKIRICSLWGILAHLQHEDMHSQTRLEMELLCSCNLISKVVQCNAIKFTKNLMRCVHLEDTKTLWENCNSPWWNVKRHYVDVHSMSRLMVEPFFFHSS